jgi:transglutaminase-like putative cysteine protease
MRHNRATDKDIQLLLVLIIAYNIIPHADLVPLWVDAIALLMLGWKVLHLTRGVAIPPRWLLWSISATSSLGVYFEFGTLLGPEAASAILVCLASSKLLETNRYRDAMFVIFTSYFLLMSFLLSTQSLFATLYMASDVLFITMLMFHIHRRDRRTSARSLRPAMRLLGLSLPVWIFLFVVFPRFSTGILGQNAKASVSGSFDEEVNPGSVEKLVQSDESMFRVTFATPNSSPPSPESLYWRGSILTLGDGLNWKHGTFNQPDIFVEQPTGKSLNYEVWLEPTVRRWLFLLDYPVSFRPDQEVAKLMSRKSSGLVYKLIVDLPTRASFSATSMNVPPIQRLSPPEKTEDLQLPDGLDQRIDELTKSWTAEWLKTNKLIAESVKISREEFMSYKALRWFGDNGFRYSKSPGAMSGKSGVQQLNSFLFTKKVGFCEHFATAFATLMRAAKVPSRVTVGFQGGKINDYGHYMLVRSLDAHAWTEIWIENPARAGTGSWKRVDPTFTIAPLRIQLGGDFNKNETDLIAGGTETLRRGLTGTMTLLSAKFALAWDAAQMKWNSFLLGYDFEFQKELVKKVGWKEASRWVFGALAGLGCALFVFILTVWLRRKGRKEDPVVKNWRVLCAKLDRVGLSRLSTEGPLQFASRVAERRPDLAAEIKELSTTYANLRYGPKPDMPVKVQQIEFAKAVRQFRAKELARH